jgi:Uma2 family endonuclease
MQRKMAYMRPPQELIEGPLTTGELAERYRELCDDPRYADVPGKFELDVWGRILMSPPPSNYHGALQFRLGQKLAPLGGQVLVEASVVSPRGVFVADVVWASGAFIERHKFETPFTSAPEICIQVVSPSNSIQELDEKVEAYLAAGAHEVWIAYPESKRCQFYGPSGLLESSAYAVDLAGLFDGEPK